MKKLIIEHAPLCFLSIFSLSFGFLLSFFFYFCFFFLYFCFFFFFWNSYFISPINLPISNWYQSQVLSVSYNNHDPNASMAESQFERLQQQISSLMQMMEETNTQMVAFLNRMLPKVSLSKSLAASPLLLANLPEQQPTKDTPPVNPKQAVTSTKSAHLPCRTSP